MLQEGAPVAARLLLGLVELARVSALLCRSRPEGTRRRRLVAVPLLAVLMILRPRIDAVRRRGDSRRRYCLYY